jgi:putative oxidoreductase
MNEMNQMNFALAFLRVAVGAMIAMHGYAHVWRGGKIKGTAGWFGSIGMRPPLVQAWMASLTEMGSGLLLIVGFLTPLAAAGVLGVMVVAFVTAHRNNGFFIYNAGQGWEYVAIISAAAIAIGTLGAGEWSFDNAFSIDLFTGWKGLATTAIAGIGGAALLLATCWRPPAKP